MASGHWQQKWGVHIRFSPIFYCNLHQIFKDGLDPVFPRPSAFNGNNWGEADIEEIEYFLDKNFSFAQLLREHFLKADMYILDCEIVSYCTQKKSLLMRFS